MPTIDLFDMAGDFLRFDSEDDFYYLQILQRKKENPHLGSNRCVIRNYYIRSLDYLMERADEIRSICDHLNARAMLRLNRRSFRRVAFEAQKLALGYLQDRQAHAAAHAFDKACGKHHSDPDKTWILDIDYKPSDEEMGRNVDALSALDPVGPKVKFILPTRNGFHIVTRPFNVAQVHQGQYDFPTEANGWACDIHKDNPINLYIP